MFFNRKDSDIEHSADDNSKLYYKAALIQILSLTKKLKAIYAYSTSLDSQSSLPGNHFWRSSSAIIAENVTNLLKTDKHVFDEKISLYFDARQQGVFNPSREEEKEFAEKMQSLMDWSRSLVTLFNIDSSHAFNELLTPKCSISAATKEQVAELFKSVVACKTKLNLIMDSELANQAPPEIDNTHTPSRSGVGGNNK